MSTYKNMQRLVSSIYNSRSFNIVSNSRTITVSCEPFLVTKYRYSCCQNMATTTIFTFYYTKVLNKCKLQHTSNVHKVKVMKLKTCIII